MAAKVASASTGSGRPPRMVMSAPLQGTPWLLGLRLTHYSNADIKQPNPGQDYVQLRASYFFP